MGYTASMHASFLVVGAGLAGLTAAEQIAARLGKDCLVIDRGTTSAATATICRTNTECWFTPTAPIISGRTANVLSTNLSRFNGLAPVRYRVPKLHEGPLLVLPRQFAHF